MGGRLVFEVMDEDTVMDEVVGAINLEAKDFLEDDLIVNHPDKNGKVIKQLAYEDEELKKT